MSPTIDISRVVGLPVSVERLAGLAAAKAAALRGAEAYARNDWDGVAVAFTEARRFGLDSADLHSGLGTAYMFTGRAREAIVEYQLALQRGGGKQAAKAHANLIVLLDAQPETTLDTALAARKAWWRAFGAPLRSAWQKHANDPDPERPLRVGYVSGDFRRHSAATAFASIVMRHTEGYRPVAYSTCPQQDDVTEEFIAATEFHAVADLDDAALATRIRADRIDLLVDLSGHSALNRLEAFCRRPAPVQLTGWGYAAGTGLPVMDGFFCDEYTVPKRLAARGYTEPLLYLPAIVPFAPMPYSDPPAPLPCLARGRFTFGSFNRWAKITPRVLEAWAEILAAVPGSRLLLKEKIYEREEICRQVTEAMAAKGVKADRIEFRGWNAHDEHIKAYHEVDLALDPFPHSGCVTAMEGLWHGVPPVTLVGERVPERLSASFCNALNLKAFITADPVEYVEAAVGIATKCRSQLAEIRSTLQHRMAASPLCVGHVEAVETHYRDLWRRWCRRQAS